LHPHIRHLSKLAAPILQFPPRNSSLTERIKTPRSFLFAQAAASEALTDSGLITSPENVGVYFGSGMAGVSEAFETASQIMDNVTQGYCHYIIHSIRKRYLPTLSLFFSLKIRCLVFESIVSQFFFVTTSSLSSRFVVSSSFEKDFNMLW
jgi:hypothetical protein